VTKLLASRWRRAEVGALHTHHQESLSVLKNKTYTVTKAVNARPTE